MLPSLPTHLEDVKPVPAELRQLLEEESSGDDGFEDDVEDLVERDAEAIEARRGAEAMEARRGGEARGGEAMSDEDGTEDSIADAVRAAHDCCAPGIFG